MTREEREFVKFKSKFANFKDKRIVLYGIGGNTAALLPLLAGEGWNIVGLMDSNSDNIGTIKFGLPVLGKAEVCKKAELIIINTLGSYWNIIYRRIEELDIPIYYQNGRRARKVEVDYAGLEYWNDTSDKLFERIVEHQVVSFDFLGTLFQWKANVLEEKETITMQESRLLSPRTDIMDALRYALASEKEVFIIDNEKLSAEFIAAILARWNISVKEIWTFGSQQEGVCGRILWERYRECIGTKTALHIGDRSEQDMQSAELWNIDVCYCMDKKKLLAHSSMNSIVSFVYSPYHKMILELCETRMFRDAFALGRTAGKVDFADRMDFGYIVLGPVICTFLLWLGNQVAKDGIEQLIFMGRDGYFLQEDYKYMCQLMGIQEFQTHYLETSRQILMCTRINSQDDFMEYYKFAYRGKFRDYAEDRFQIKLNKEDDIKYGDKLINISRDYEEVYVWLKPYMTQIGETVRRNRKNYLSYLSGFGLDDAVIVEKTAVVDYGYYGTNQYNLSRTLNQKIRGYYVMADITDNNPYCRENEMTACAHDLFSDSSHNTNLHLKELVIESVLTSPKGMVKGMPSENNFIYDEGKSNQKFWMDKVEINEGVKQFIKDMVELYSNSMSDYTDVYIDNFVDQWYGMCVDNCLMEEPVKRSFYNDNAFVRREEERLL